MPVPTTSAATGRTSNRPSTGQPNLRTSEASVVPLTFRRGAPHGSYAAFAVRLQNGQVRRLRVRGELKQRGGSARVSGVHQCHVKHATMGLGEFGASLVQVQ